MSPDAEQPSVTLSLVVKTAPQAKIESQTVYILQSDTPSEKGRETSSLLVSELSLQGLEAVVVPWSVDVATLQGQSLISLVELEKSIWTLLDEESFERLRKIILRSSSLLWVSMGEEDPVMHAAVGFLRVLQNENANLNLRYLHLEQESSRQATASCIAKLAASPTSDREYIQIHNALCINRWAPKDELSGLIASKGEAEGRETVKLGDMTCGLKMIHEGAGVGTSSSVYFDLDEYSSPELGPEEVEISVKAIAIK